MKLLCGLTAALIAGGMIWILLVGVLALGICLKTIVVAGAVTFMIWMLGCWIEGIWDEADRKEN